MHAAGKIFVKTYLKAIRDTVVILKGGDIFLFFDGVQSTEDYSSIWK